MQWHQASCGVRKGDPDDCAVRSHWCPALPPPVPSVFIQPCSLSYPRSPLSRDTPACAVRRAALLRPPPKCPCDPGPRTLLTAGPPSARSGSARWGLMQVLAGDYPSDQAFAAVALRYPQLNPDMERLLVRASGRAPQLPGCRVRTPQWLCAPTATAPGCAATRNFEAATGFDPPGVRNWRIRNVRVLVSLYYVVVAPTAWILTWDGLPWIKMREPCGMRLLTPEEGRTKGTRSAQPTRPLLAPPQRLRPPSTDACAARLPPAPAPAGAAPHLPAGAPGSAVPGWVAGVRLGSAGERRTGL